MVILSWNPPPPDAWKIPIMEVFWKTGGFSYEFFPFCGAENLQPGMVMSPPSVPKILTRRRVHLRKFLTVRDEKKLTENLDNPSLSLIHKKFSSPDFLRKFEVFHHEVFRHCKTNFLRREIVILPLLQKIYKSVVNSIIVENLWRPDSKQCFVFNRLQNFIKK